MLRPALLVPCPSECAVCKTPLSPNARPARPAPFAGDVCAMQCAVPTLVGVLFRMRSSQQSVASRLLSVAAVSGRYALVSACRDALPRSQCPLAWMPCGRPRGVLCNAQCVQRSPCRFALAVALLHRFVSVSLALGCHTPPSTTHSSTYALHTPHIQSSTHTACTSPRHSHLTRRAPHSHRTDRIFTTPSIIPPTPRTLRTHHIHTTPHPLITHNHPHQSHYHKLVLCSHASLRW